MSASLRNRTSRPPRRSNGPARPRDERAQPATPSTPERRPRPAARPQPQPQTPAERRRLMRPSPGDVGIEEFPAIELTIDRIVGGGLGIGFDEGLTVFVPHTAPGDRVRVRATRRQGKVVHAAIEEILEPSPMRITPRVDGEASVGLDLQHIAYADQLDVKVGIVGDSLRRIAKLDPVPDVAITPSPQEWGYRSRAEFQVDHRNGAVGYFAPNSHRIVDVAESPVLTPEVQTLLTTLRDDVAAGLVARGAREYRAVAGDVASVLEPTIAERSRKLFRTVGGDLFRFTAECFFQANIPVTEAVLARINEIADVAKREPGLALDLYCGVGLFTIPIARRFRRAVGVESFPAASSAAEENLAEAGLRNTRIVTAPVEHWLAGDRSPLGRVAFAVFDPPRSGAGPRTIENLVKLKPAHVAAVSCDPATFARDIRGLIDAGYEVVDIQAFDMFPQTHHVEIVGHLRRRFE